jgi:hypothetical protein
VSTADQLLLGSGQNQMLLLVLRLLVVQLVRLSRQGDVLVRLRGLRLQGGEFWRRRAADDDSTGMGLLGYRSAPCRGGPWSGSFVSCTFNLHFADISFTLAWLRMSFFKDALR